MCILDLSKILWEFHYDYIRNKYGNKLRLIFIDTDSLMYETKRKYVYEYFSEDKEMFAVSNYFVESKYYDDLLLWWY